MGDFQGGRKIETSFPLEWRFWLLLSLLTKVTRRRQKEKRERKAPGRGRAPPLHTPTDSLCAIRAGGCGHPPLRNHRRRMRHTHGRTEPSRPTTAYRQQKHFPNQWPKAATYLCRFAAKARFDNRPNPRRVFPKREGRSPPSLVAQGWGIFKGEGRSKLPSPLNGAFGYFCRY